MGRFDISVDPLDTTALGRGMADASAGAFVSFEGWVRDSNDGHDVTALEYEVFDALACSEGQAILNDAIARFGLVDACAVHRAGRLAVGDCAVWVGVTARHRGEAFAACREIMDAIKHRLPIWKKEHYIGLAPEWIGAQSVSPAPLMADAYYARQLRLPELGAGGQAQLGAAKILVVGVGGLGAAAASCLAAAGIGTIGVADPDRLDISNLHRQMIYSAADIGKPKAALAAARLRALNPFISVEALALQIEPRNIDEVFARFDLVLDCTDNFAAKYLLSDGAIRHAKPLVQAGLYRFEGQLLTIDAANGAGCLRCLFPAPPAEGAVGDCATVGILGTVPALFGTLQANEAIKYILGLPVSTDLLLFDLLSLQSQKLARTRDPNCRICAGVMPSSLKESLKMNDIDLTLNAADTDENLRRRFRFIDVREAEELIVDPVVDALHIPMSAFDLSVLDAAPDTPLLVICARGARSHRAATYLRQQGWTQAYSLVGGFPSLPARGVVGE